MSFPMFLLSLFPGNRHILLNSTMWMREVAQIMAKEFKPHGKNMMAG